MAQNTFYAPFATAVLAFGLINGMKQEKPVSQQESAQRDDHHQGVVERGDHVMGFSHDKTIHHFRLYADGGAIEAEATDSQDAASSDAIRSHFTHIAKMFAAGDFTATMLIHVQNPPGPQEMKQLRDAIQYKL